MAGIGCLDKFQVRKEDFDHCTNRMEQYFITNFIAEEKQVAVFLTAIGGPTYELLRNLSLPAALKDKNLAKWKNVFGNTSIHSLSQFICLWTY